MNRAVSSFTRRIAVGAVNNLVFTAGGQALLLLQSITVMRVIGPEQTGLYAIALAIALTLDSVSDFGVPDRLVQVREDRVPESYGFALIIQLTLGVALWLLIYLAAPGLARFWEQPDLERLLPSLGYMSFGGATRLPVALLYREMRFFEQRIAVFAGRVAGFLLTMVSVYQGAGVWSLVYGGAVTLLVTGVLAWSLAPVRPRLGRAREELRSLLGFSLPVWLSKVTYVVVQQGSVLTLSTMLGAADVGQFKSAEQLASLVFYVEVVLGQTVFPAYCRLAHSDDAMSKAFLTASRLSMAWIGAAAAGLVLFAHDIVQFILTPAWAGTELFLMAQGVALIFGAALFNWDAVFKARNETGPLLQMAILFLLNFVGVFVPLVYVFGRAGAAAGLVIMAAVTLAARVYHIRRVNLRISLSTVMRPAIMAALIGSAVSVVSSLSLSLVAEPVTSTPLQAIMRVVLFVLIYAVALYRFDGALLRSAAAALVGRATISSAEGRV